MSGCIDIDQNTSWMVATWAFDLALRSIAKYLDAAASPHVAELIQRAMPPKLRLLPLDEAPLSEVPAFLAALQRAREEFARGDWPEWDSTEARDSFLKALDDLTMKVEARLGAGS